MVRRELADIRQKHPQLIDMTLVRRVRVGQVTLISLPGYHNAFYLEAKERGCAYVEADLDDVAGLVDAERVNVLLSPSPPAGSSHFSVDRGRGDVNIGDPALRKMFEQTKLRFGVFGHVYESGGHATSGDNALRAQSGVWHDSLLLQAGAAESVPLSLVDGGRAIGMSHIVEISGPRARFRTIMAASQSDSR